MRRRGGGAASGHIELVQIGCDRSRERQGSDLTAGVADGCQLVGEGLESQQLRHPELAGIDRPAGLHQLELGGPLATNRSHLGERRACLFRRFGSRRRVTLESRRLGAQEPRLGRRRPVALGTEPANASSANSRASADRPADSITSARDTSGSDAS